MSARRLVAGAIALVVAALAVVLVVAALHRPGQANVRLTGPASVTRSFSPVDPQFGDTVTATIDVFVDLRRVDVGSVKVTTGFAPYRIASVERTVDRQGSVGIVHLEHRLRCLAAACVPDGERAAFRFAPVRVGYMNGARPATLQARWPELRVHARAGAADVRQPFLRVDPPQAARSGYRLSPRPTAYVLFGLAGLFALAGAALLLRAGILGVRRRGRSSETAIDRVLAELAAVSTNGDSGRRRRALEELARELEPVDEPLSAESRVLAWAPADPQPATIADLTARVLARVKQ